MTKERYRYVFFVSLIAFGIWLFGEILIAVLFPEATMTASKVWVVVVFSAACAWSLIRFHREDKRREEEKENENYKGIY